MKRRKFLQAASFFPFFGTHILDKKFESTNGGNLNYQPKFIQPEERSFFFKPPDAWAADFIPYHANGEYQLFYLHDWRDKEKHGEGTPWYRLTTKDFINFQEHGEVLARGTKQEQDLYVFTGSVIKAKEQYHIFYTGHNDHFIKEGKPQQAVMHAVSDDLQHWKKIPADTFFAPDEVYEKHDWRDPFVFWNDEDNEYNMLLAARYLKGIPRRRGLTALCSSKDLIKWQVKDPFFAPDLYFTHECPDLFKIGNWWYLVFSEFSDRVQTRYRMSRTLAGPWLVPLNDSFDGHAFYAAKTASDGNRRFIFGWNPTKVGNKDEGNWQWGGNLVVHEIHQEKNGELSVSVPDTVAKAFNRSVNFGFTSGTGKFSAEKNKVTINAEGTFSAASAGKLLNRCKISMNISSSKDMKGGCGIMLCASDDFDRSYYIRLEPVSNRVVFDMWPRKVNEIPFMADLERKIEPVLSPVKFEVFIDGTIGVADINDKVAMNFRMYDLPKGNWGVFAMEGSALFSDIMLYTL